MELTLKNEASLTEMKEILSQYIPIHESTREEITEGTNYTFDNPKIIQILLFDDQLTIVCSRGAVHLREDDKAAINCLNGFIPAIADRHATMFLLRVRILHAHIISCACVGYMEKALQQGVFEIEGYTIPASESNEPDWS